jgi:hypothetical protein
MERDRGPSAKIRVHFSNNVRFFLDIFHVMTIHPQGHVPTPLHLHPRFRNRRSGDGTDSAESHEYSIVRSVL